LVRPKKHLGQHFLTERSIAERIATSLSPNSNSLIVEIGPGTGVLTQFFIDKSHRFMACEVDVESIDYLGEHFPELLGRILHQDFLQLNLADLKAETIQVIGNFPYNISSQILFRIYEQFNLVSEVVGMFQKEVAQRVAAQPGSKTYGILSVLLQTYYDIEYLFTVKPGSFKPPPKVDSGIIKLVRNQRMELPCTSAFYTQLVKQAFNQRRKTLRNAIKSQLPENRDSIPYLNQRAEELSVDDFLTLAAALQHS
jgi:16S rRNA (adenine1518-N6/adenine1519-N6)-dimethyltransferase